MLTMLPAMVGTECVSGVMATITPQGRRLVHGDAEVTTQRPAA